MVSSAEILAREIHSLRRRITDLERTAQLTRSTVVDKEGNELPILAGIRAGWEAQATAASAIAAAATAQHRADGAVVAFFGSAEPGGAKPGDIWRKPNGDVAQFSEDPEAGWVDIGGTEVAEAMERLAATEEALDGKITTYYATDANEPDDPATGDLWIVSDLDNLIRRYDGTAWQDSQIGTYALADYAVTASKLEADLVLASRLIAGNPSGKRAEMTPDGFYVYSEEGGNIREVARLGIKNKDDYFAVAKADGTAMATISEDGVLSGAQLNSDSVFYNGDELGTVIQSRPGGLVAWGQRTTRCSQLTSSLTRQPYLRVDAMLQPGRMYKLWTSPLVVVTNNTSEVYLSYKIGDQATVYNDTFITRVRNWQDWGQVTLNGLFSLPATYTVPTTVSFLVSYASTDTNANAYTGLYCDTDRVARLVIEDMGRYVADSGIVTLNKATDSVALADLRTMSFTAQSTVTYGGSTPEVSSGHAGYIGRRNTTETERKTLVTFPNMTTDLAGRTIESVRLQVNMQFWQAGTDALGIGIHGYADGSHPSSFSDDGIITTVSSFPAPSSRWIDLPSSTFNGLRTGTIRGVTFRRPTTRTNATDYYGILSNLNPTQLEVKFH